MITLFNHENSPVWSTKNGAIAKSANGAKSYSKVITEYYFPVFKKLIQLADGNPLTAVNNKNTAVITVTTENNPIRFGDYQRIFLFLHECRYRQQPTIARAKRFAEMNSHAEVWFIVWEEDTAEELRRNKLNALFLPMAIDVEEVRSHMVNSKKNNRIIWFGNIREQKRPYYKYFLSECRKQGITVDTISGSRFNNSKDYKMDRDDILRCLQYYKYGVGVGICAHEMSALGLKVFIYSYNYKCNCAYTKEQGEFFIHRNLCSPELASTLVPNALKNRENMVVIDPVDVRDNVKLLDKSLRKILKINDDK